METPKLEWAAEWAGNPKTSYLAGGRAPKDGAEVTSLNPANGKPAGRFVEASPGVVDRAVACAAEAFAGWRATPRTDRAQALHGIASLLRSHVGELATLESLDNGKLFREAVEDIEEAAAVFDYYAGWTNKFYGETAPVEGEFVNYIVNEPLGVCALIVPWNFPLLLSSWKLAPALAMGNTTVLKPSPFTSLSSVRFFEILHEAKALPPGVCNLVLGDVAVGEALTAHADVAKISFTGSTAVGKRIASQAALSTLKGVSLELGGKSPNILFEDPPDLAFAMDRSFDGLFSHKGEKCSAPTRLLVHESLYAKVCTRLVERANAIVCGDPFDPKSGQGPQCHQAHFEKILSYIESGRREGARCLAGGERDVSGTNADGLYIRPTIFADVAPHHRIAREEIFGPVLCVTPFATEDEAVALANGTIYGLAAGLWTKDLSRAHRVAARLDAGQVFINRYGCYDFASPFGGFRQSGWGKEMAIHSLRGYTKSKSIWVKI